MAHLGHLGQWHSGGGVEMVSPPLLVAFSVARIVGIEHVGHHGSMTLFHVEHYRGCGLRILPRVLGRYSEDRLIQTCGDR